MKEQSDLQPIVDAYKEYKACKQTIEDSLAILDEESDEEMRELAKNDQMRQIASEKYEAGERQTVIVTGAGRTDAGVHALGQVAHFDCTKVMSSFHIRRIWLFRVRAFLS